MQYREQIYSQETSGCGVFLHPTNNGNNWSMVNNGSITTSNVKSLAVLGTNIFAGTWYDGVFRSTNNGSNRLTGLRFIMD